MSNREKVVYDRGFTVQLLMCAIAILAFAGAQADAKQFPGRGLFQRMVGEWTSEGKLTSSVSGDVIKVTESWVGKFDEGEGSFTIEGDRIWNGEAQTFKWKYSYNATTESLDVIYTTSSLDKELSMAVSVNEVEGIISLLAPMGTDGAEIQIENKFLKGKLISKVAIKGSDGQTVLEGELKHSQKKSNLKDE